MDIKVVPMKDWEVLKKYLHKTRGAEVALIPADFYNLMDEKVKARMHEAAPTYNHECEPDYMVEMVDYSDHYFISHSEDDSDV